MLTDLNYTGTRRVPTDAPQPTLKMDLLGEAVPQGAPSLLHAVNGAQGGEGAYSRDFIIFPQHTLALF